MLATVRNRRGVVSAVEPFDGHTGRLHLVHLQYHDNRAPSSERILWELEPANSNSLLEPNALPNSSADAMPPDDFDALLRAARWTALSPYLDPDGDGPLGREPIASPFHGGVRIEDYQLVPLLKALRMPRVSLLIADDVGLGKTVEAGLILTELLLRRRIRRILVLTPASLRQQWRDELWEKFSLRFEIVDRQGTERLRRRLGMDANPWRSHSRIVASYHYLRQPDVREQFLSACQTPEGSPHLPWDLLIVDECHNLMPSPFGRDSELCETLRLIAPRFEHRLFLSATPHNGHTRSFTGLLEMLDPVRFTRTSEMGAAMRKRVHDVVVRRLKRHINEDALGKSETGAPRFSARRPPCGLPLTANAREVELAAAFDTFRAKIRSLIAQGTSPRRRAGAFAIEILGKRLLSCPAAFAESWRRAREGFSSSTASEADLRAAERVLRQDTGDDREIQQREATAATVAGAWLRNFVDDVRDEINRIEQAVKALGFALDGPPIVEQNPTSDARFDALVGLIERLLLEPGNADGTKTGEYPEFRSDERLIVFTEYKTTLDYLARRLREQYPAERVLTLFGAGGPDGMNDTDRENVKAEFNDPMSTVRVLIATDAASEGLNLHLTARYLLHYDCPWNPSRLEQRNGRLDRYGQARDVTVHHFVSEADPDIRFLGHVVRKADEIREDLGSVNEVFDRAVHSRLIEGKDVGGVEADLEAGVNALRNSVVIDADAAHSVDGGTGQVGSPVDAMGAEIDLDPQALGSALETAMAISGGRPQFQVGEERGLYRVLHPDLPGWRDVIDEAVRLPAPGGQQGPMRQLAFSPEPFLRQLGSFSVFLPRRDAVLLHLAHPMIRRALGMLTRRRYPGSEQVSRWTVRMGGVPPDADALVLLSVEELAVNNLRETFHRWVRTVAFPVENGLLREATEHVPTDAYRGARALHGPEERITASAILDDVSASLKKWQRDYRDELTGLLGRQLEDDRKAARAREDERYRERQGELSSLIESQTVGRLEREIEQLVARKRQGQLFDEGERLTSLTQSIEAKQEELDRRRTHYEDLREQLRNERERILDHLLPARFAMAGEAQVFPVAVEVRLPKRRS